MVNSWQKVIVSWKRSWKECTLLGTSCTSRLHCTGDECIGIDDDVLLQENVQSEFARSRNRTVRVPERLKIFTFTKNHPKNSQLRSRKCLTNSDPGSGPMVAASSTTATRKNQGAGKSHNSKFKISTLFRADEVKINPVPKSVASVSKAGFGSLVFCNSISPNPWPKELIKLHIDVDEIVSFDGFGPWMRPVGFEPPMPVEKPKKRKRKEANNPVLKEKKEPDNKGTSADSGPRSGFGQPSLSLPIAEPWIREEKKPNITDIVALSSHKTHSTPVDPVELKKRLVDLLVQRQSRGEQQALKLKVILNLLQN